MRLKLDKKKLKRLRDRLKKHAAAYANLREPSKTVSSGLLRYMDMFAADPGAGKRQRGESTEDGWD